MTADDAAQPDGQYIEFFQRAIDYGIRGCRHWSDLNGREQDEYIWACFEGEAARIAAEERLQLLDRIAMTVADNLLGPFRQLDDSDGCAHYQPEGPARVGWVLLLRMVALRGTPLGDRLVAADRRRRGRPEGVSYNGDPELRFEYIGSSQMRGLEIMAEESFGGYIGIDPYRGAWNDWTALELQQAREIQQAKLERSHREMNSPATLRADLPHLRQSVQSRMHQRREDEPTGRSQNHGAPSVSSSPVAQARILRMLGVVCWVLQGIVTLGVQAVIPIGWLFFGWRGPVESVLGRAFVCQIADVLLWMVASMAAMFVTTALQRIMERLLADPTA